MSTQSKKQTKAKAETISNQPYRLILGNDDYNSFEWVIKCLKEICNHEQNQAEQCAFIVHTRGKCDVKYGDEETISKMKNKLRSAGLCATMEKN